MSSENERLAEELQDRISSGRLHMTSVCSCTDCARQRRDITALLDQVERAGWNAAVEACANVAVKGGGNGNQRAAQATRILTLRRAEGE